MENNENELLDQEQPIPAEASVQEEVPNAAAQPEPEVEEEISDYVEAPGRKSSPFADSPFVMNRAPESAHASVRPTAWRKAEKPWKKVLAAVLVVALVVAGCAITAGAVSTAWEARAEQMTADFQQQLQQLRSSLENQIDRVGTQGTSVSGTPAAAGDSLTPGQVYAQNVSSVVMVYTELQSMGQVGYSTGSGFILSEEGYVVTNYHVVEGGRAYLVVTNDNVRHEATFVGGDAANDIAVLKIEAQGLQSVKLGSSDALIVGDQVAAIGNPLGELTSTLTVGYVSAKGRYVTTESTTINMLQTDCAINSGNSGGPLFNMKGEVVGITTAKYSGTSNSGATIEGIGFAIPMDDVLAVIEDLVEFGHVNGAYLGVEVNNQNEITPGLPKGAYIVRVTPGYCAEKAGIRADDYIIELDGHAIESMNDLTRILRRLRPGDVVSVVVLRGTQEITLELTLDPRPQDTTVTDPSQQIPLPEEGDFDEWYEYFHWFFENQQKP